MELRAVHISRILGTIQLMYSRKNGITAKELSEISQTSLKTAYRDLETIENAGFPITTETRDGKKYFILIEGFKKEFPLTFTIDELVALYYSKDTLDFFQGTHFYKSIESIIQKIKKNIPEKMLTSLKNIDKNLTIASRRTIQYSQKKDIIKNINNAITKNLSLELTYSGAKNKTAKTRIIDPYSLYVSQGLLYLIAFCHFRQDLRIFAVTRMTAVTLIQSHFEKPKDFNVDTFFDSSFNVYLGKEKRTIRLLFSKKIAPYIEERIIHKSQKLLHTDEGLLVEIECAITPDLKTFLMSWGEDLIVLEPYELQEELKHRHISAANASSRITSSKQAVISRGP